MQVMQIRVGYRYGKKMNIIFGFKFGFLDSVRIQIWPYPIHIRPEPIPSRNRSKTFSQIRSLTDREYTPQPKSQVSKAPWGNPNSF